jgi:guanylate kinase
VLAATSGTGKTTLARRLVEGDARYCFSTSATTRPPRDRERDGVDYHFLSEDEFDERVERGDFVEWARVHGRRYGTLRSEVEKAAERGQHVVLDIDVQGAAAIRAAVPDAKLVFVLPPSVDIMMARLEGRGTEADSEIVSRRFPSSITWWSTTTSRSVCRRSGASSNGAMSLNLRCTMRSP